MGSWHFSGRRSRRMVSTPRRLRVSVVVKCAPVPAWVSTLVQRLDASQRFDVLAFLDTPPVENVWPTAYRLYERLDARIFRQRRDALAAAAVPGLRPRDMAMAEECDVVLHLGWRRPDAFVDAPRYGVWTLSHTEQERCRIPPVFWEMYRGDLCRTTLEALLPGGDRRVLYTSLGRTNRTSLHRSRNAAYWKAHGAIARALDALYERGACYMQSRPRAEETPIRTEQRTPSASTVARHAAKVSFGVVARRLRKIAFKEEWFVATRAPGRHSLVDEHAESVDGFRPLVAPRGQHFADPFLFEERGKTYLFFERYDEGINRASIACTQLDVTANTIGSAMPALSRNYHVSYPFVFRHRGDIFMIPESLEHKTVELFRAVEFPSRWSLEGCLLDEICAVDATLLEEGSRLWLFVGVAEPGASVNDELHLYSASTLRGPWIPHPENPVVSDVRSARPAGRIFRHDGQIIRPSQDCSRGYGTAVVFNRIDVLTLSQYAETAIGRIEPTWSPGLLGTHTYNCSRNVEAVDGRRFAFRLPIHQPTTHSQRRR
jgi:hypothetical protein